MPLTITDEELAQTDLPAERVRVELAVALRDRNELSFFNAAKWAGMDARSFGALLTERGVPWFDAGSGDPDEYFGQDAVLSELRRDRVEESVAGVAA